MCKGYEFEHLIECDLTPPIMIFFISLEKMKILLDLRVQIIMTRSYIYYMTLFILTNLITLNSID
jgi:hypothetical protein